MKERILEFLKKENKTSSQFAEEIGVQASSVSHIVSGRNKPSLDFIIKMLQKYDDLSTDWLMFGKGSMYKDTVPDDLFADLGIETSDQAPASPEFQSNQTSSPLPASDLPSIEEAMPGTKSVVQVILVYKDNSFRVYNPG